MPLDPEDRTPPDPNAGGVVSQGAPWNRRVGPNDPQTNYMGGDTGITPMATQLLYAQQSKARGWVRMTDGSWWPPDKVRQLGAQGRVSPVQDISAQTVNPDWAPGGGIAAGGAGFGAGKTTDTATAERILSGAGSGGGGGGSSAPTGDNAPAPGGVGPSPYGNTATATIGEYTKAKALAASTLQTLGIFDYTPTDAELGSFIQSGFDAEAISKYYSSLPTLIARQPGLPYGKSREQYYQDRSQVEGSFAKTFDTATERSDVPLVQSKAAQPTVGGNIAEPDWLKEVFKEGMSPQEAQQNFADYFRRLGKAPTAEDVSTFRTRATNATAFDRASPAPGKTGASVGLGGPDLGVGAAGRR